MGKKLETESVWDYPRPPLLENVSQHISVSHAGQQLVSTNGAVRVLETSHPPTYYLPIADFAAGILVPNGKQTYCEFKGAASYFDLQVGGAVIRGAAWTYKNPTKGFENLLGKVAIYASAVDQCKVGDEVVMAQEGDFYGGWITSNITGPFKGAPGTMGW
ncbi:DUF427 domain-containing protein [Aquiluna sp.]|nr:DUF427 domain-containing protein [Aquiluna sp.]MDB4254378.1 DUF427 domain-containing protein [Aquiluna sp.]